MVDRPNHDDAAVLNEKVLNEFYAESCEYSSSNRFYVTLFNDERASVDNVEYGMAVRSFIEGGCLSDDEKENLVAIATAILKLRFLAALSEYIEQCDSHLLGLLMRNLLP